jgi:hypothetical protein
MGVWRKEARLAAAAADQRELDAAAKRAALDAEEARLWGEVVAERDAWTDAGLDAHDVLSLLLRRGDSRGGRGGRGGRGDDGGKGLVGGEDEEPPACFPEAAQPTQKGTAALAGATQGMPSSAQGRRKGHGGGGVTEVLPSLAPRDAAPSPSRVHRQVKLCFTP